MLSGFFRCPSLGVLRRLPCLVGVALVSLSSAALAQEVDDPIFEQWYSVAPEFRERLEVHVGSVDVTVLDKKTGEAVPGLLPDAFVLLVDGEPRVISNFAAYGRSSPPMTLSDTSAPPSAESEPRQLPIRPQLFVIFIDNENISRANRNIVLNRLESFVREYIYPPHRALVVINNPGLRRVGKPTSDADEILENLESLVGTTTGATKVQAYAGFAETQIRELAARAQNRQNRQIDLDQALATARMNSAQTDEAVLQAVATLKTLIRIVGGAPGKKDVIYVSDGIPRSPGLELFLLVDELFQVRDGIQQTQERDRILLYLQVVAYARAADITVHTIDAAGLQVVHGSKADTAWYRTADYEMMRRENYQAPLFFMADQTGGIAVINTNEIEKGLLQVGGAARTYYSLGFSLESPLQDRTHRVEIRLPDHPDYVLRYRPVFRERTSVTRAAERTMTGLLLDLDDNPLGIVAEVGDAGVVDKKNWMIPVLVHVPLTGLTLFPAGDMMTGRVSIFFVAGSDDGAKSKFQHSSQAVEVLADRVDDIATATFKIEVQTESGTDRISLGVIDETSSVTGYTVVDVALPD